MKTDKQTFILIVKNAIFIFFKEKYFDDKIEDSDDKGNIKKLVELLLKLEKYGHVPDKKKIVTEHYHSIKKIITDDKFEEEEFLESLKRETEEMSVDEKKYILNSVIFISYEDKHISDKEKESILQISKILNIDLEHKEIMKFYRESELYQQSLPKALIAFGLLILMLSIGFVFWKVKTQPKIQTFDTNKYQFDEITFNRYILYKNKFEQKNDELIEHFKKYAVYYIAGKAQISFNPKKLTYNSTLKTITLSEDFIIDLKILKKDEIDKVLPKGISQEEAKSIGVVVGFAGAYAGAKVGSGLGSYLPSTLKMASTVGGGMIGGTTSYLVTSKALEGATLTGGISMSERKETLKIGESLIRVQLKTDDKLLSMYRKHFELFIKAKYKTLNKEVNRVIYSQNLKETK